MKLFCGPPGPAAIIDSVPRVPPTHSQPSIEIQLTVLGSRLPKRPKTARERVNMGAAPSLPATLKAPTRRKDSSAPSAAAARPCRKSSPKPRMIDP